MSAPDNSIDALIDNGRALMDALLENNWLELHVVSGGCEVFIAHWDGKPNPMRNSQALPAIPPTETSPAVTIVTAPHVATFVDSLAVGTAVSVGETVAQISVLDAVEPVMATIAGIVSVIHAVAGDMVEYKVPLVSIVEDRS